MNKTDNQEKPTTKFDYFQKYIDSTQLPINSNINDKSINFTYRDHYIKIAIEPSGSFHIDSTSMKMNINMYGNTKDRIIEGYLTPFIDIVLADTISERTHEMKLTRETLLQEKNRITSARDQYIEDRQKIIKEYEARLKSNGADIEQLDEKLNALNVKSWQIESDENFLRLSHRSIMQKIKKAEH
jgi:hypothetical protein